MADGITHAHYAQRTATALTFVGVVAAIYHPVMLGIVAGGWLGRIVDPDLDIEDKHTQSEQYVWKYNKLLGVFWSAYWYPYGAARGHRGVSHTWPRGTAERYIYALWLPLAVTFWAFDLVPCLCWWLLVFCGLSVQDGVHLWLDSEL